MGYMGYKLGQFLPRLRQYNNSQNRRPGYISVLVLLVSFLFSTTVGDAFAHNKWKEEWLWQEPSGASEGVCYGAAFEKVIHAKKIKGHRKVYFALSDLDVLRNPGFHIDAVYLDLVLTKQRFHKHDNHCRNNHHDHEFQDVSIAMNGIKTVTKVGSYIWVWKESKHHKKDRVRLSLQYLLLNGAEPFKKVFAKILRSKGLLKLSFRGRLHIASASLRIAGHQVLASCPLPPDPTPSPAPSVPAPKTFFDGAAPQSSPTNSTTMSLAFHSDQTGVTFNCSLNGAAAEVCSSPKIYSNLATGHYTFSVTSTNAQGLSDATGAVYSWDVDMVPPADVSLGAAMPAATVTNSTDMSLSFSSSEPSTTFQCALDGRAYAPCTSPVVYSNLTEGIHNISIIQIDAAGNTSVTAATYQWRVDLTAPTATLVQVDPASTLTSSVSNTFTFAADESSTFECSVDGAAFQSCQSPFVLGNVAEGNHTFSVRAIDVAGNQGTPVSYTWTRDATAPVITLGAVQPATQSLSNATQVSVEFFVSEPAQTTCSWDGAVATTCASPWVQTVSTSGVHSLVIMAQDAAGNAADAVTVSWTMDYTTPQISFGTMVPSAASYINSNNLLVNINASKQVTFSATLDGVALAQQTSPLSLSGLTEGGHTLVVTGVDQAGNAANTISHSFTVDTAVPVAQINSVQFTGTTTENWNSWTFSANEPLVTYSCNFDGAGFASCISPYSVSGLIAANHVFQVKAIDFAGNESAVVSFTWTVEQLPPDTTPPTAISGSISVTSTTATITWTTSEPTTTQLRWGLGSSTANVTPEDTTYTTTHTVVLTGLNPNTVYSYLWAGHDPAGNVLANVTRRAFRTNP